MLKTTLCYLKKNDHILMLYRNKKENDPCQGKWVGIGGKFEAGEDAEQCLLREVYEETGLKLCDYHFHGIVHFKSDRLPDEDMYLYSASSWCGEALFAYVPCLEECPEEDKKNTAEKSFSCSEGTLCWIPMDKVLDLNLWEGDRYFLEPLLNGDSEISMTCRYEGDRLMEVY